MEYDYLIDTVQELRLEYTVYLIHDSALHELVVLFGRTVTGVESETLGAHDLLCTCIGSHDDDGVLEGHLSSLCICDMTVIKYLKKYVQYIRMCFFYLVEKDNGVRISAYLFAELAALIITHISWRRTDHLGDAVFLHVFRHINTDQVVL